MYSMAAYWYKLKDMDHDLFSVRPGVPEFLRAMHSHYELVIFTAAIQEVLTINVSPSLKYMDQALKLVDPEELIEHKLYRDHCSYDPS